MGKRKISNIYKVPRSRTKFERPVSAANTDNMDDFNIVDSINVNQVNTRAMNISGGAVAEGTISAAYLAGDGTNITGISGDNLGNHIATQTISGADLVLTGVINDEVISGISGAAVLNTAKVSYTDATQFQVISAATIVNTADITTLSGARVVNTNDITTLSGARVLNTTDIAQISSGQVLLSAAYIAHAGDTSDPHGAAITQTNLSAGHMSITGDHTSISGAYIANIVFSLGTEPGAANLYPQGTIHVQYTA